MSDLTDLIRRQALSEGLPWELVQAICQVESSLNPWAMRFEPNYRWFVGNVDALSATERNGQQISWGVCQIMGAVAREHGFTGWFPKLCDPATGLTYGIKHLKGFFVRYGNWPDVIASYNAGSPVKVDGQYQNRHYVDAVLREWNRLEIQVQTRDSEA